MAMVDPMVVQVSPTKNNLCFEVRKIEAAEECFVPLAERLKEQRLAFKRTIIFCQLQLD